MSNFPWTNDETGLDDFDQLILMEENGMKRFKLIVTVFDELEFKDKEEAKKAADEWAAEIQEEQSCEIADVQVDEVD